jgi:hypothetical protein
MPSEFPRSPKLLKGALEIAAGLMFEYRSASFSISS